jgi:hypothetical protein
METAPFLPLVLRVIRDGAFRVRLGIGSEFGNCFGRNGSEPSAEQWSRHWRACVEQARDCDVLLFVNNEGERTLRCPARSGRGVGCGAASVRCVARRVDVHASSALPCVLNLGSGHRGHHGTAFDIAGFPQSIVKCAQTVARQVEPFGPLLRARRDRPRGRRAAEQRLVGKREKRRR